MWEAQNITVIRQDKLLLDDVSFKAPSGCLTALLGPNGAGKSTLLKVLSGELKPDSGSVLMDNQPLKDWDQRALARQRAVLPQSSTLSFSFMVQDVVSMGWHPHSPRALPPHLVPEALESVGMKERAQQSYTRLSGGERQRTHLARILVQLEGAVRDRPRGLLLDEPLASLDLARRLEVLILVRKLTSRGVAVVMVVHDLNVASAWADHLVFLRDGRLIVQGSAQDVIQPDVLRDVFSLQAEVVHHPHHGFPMILPPVPERL